jgi:hypothetical protein
MASQYTHDIVATIGEYTDRQTGDKKKRYVNVGKCFTDDQGRQSLKLETIPVGPEWSGWLSLYPTKDRERRPAPAHRQPLEKQRHEQAKADAFDDSDEVPF